MRIEWIRCHGFEMDVRRGVRTSMVAEARVAAVAESTWPAKEMLLGDSAASRAASATPFCSSFAAFKDLSNQANEKCQSDCAIWDGQGFDVSNTFSALVQCRLTQRAIPSSVAELCVVDKIMAFVLVQPMLELSCLKTWGFRQ